MSTPTAGWDTPTLIGSLGRAGWGVLAGHRNHGARAILKAIVDLLPHGSGTGLATADQIARAAGYSERHTRRMLAALEGLGLITWHRGTLVAGRPRPGVITIIKRAIVAVIEDARTDGTREARAEARRDALKARLATLRSTTQRPRRLSRRPDMVSTLLPLRGGNRAGANSAEPLCSTCHRTRRAHDTANRTDPTPHPWDTSCPTPSPSDRPSVAPTTSPPSTAPSAYRRALLRLAGTTTPTGAAPVA